MQLLSEPIAATCSHWFLVRGFLYPEDGGDIFLRNAGSHKKYTAPHPRNLHSSSFLLFTRTMRAIRKVSVIYFRQLM
jgi:hypothetical protein